MTFEGRRRSTAVVTLIVFACVAPAGVLAQQPDAELKALAERGETALAENRYADAEQAYEKLRELSPAIAEVHARLGLIYFQQGKFSQAVPALQQATKLKPSLPNTDVLLAMSLSELGRYEEALPGLEKGFKRSQDAVLKRLAGLRLQRAYTELRRDDDAVGVALELTKRYPKDPEVLYHASRLYANLAYVTIQRLQRVAPDSVWMHLTAGEVEESQGGFDGALREYRAALALQPGRAGLHFRIGRVLLARSQQGRNANDAAEALEEFAQELHTDPTNANAAYEIAEIHRKTGDAEAARKYFEQALKYYPEFQEAHVGLGRTLIALQRPEAALPHLQEAIRLNPGDEVAYYQLAQAYRLLGNSTEQQKAMAEFQRAKEQKSAQPATSSPAHRDVTQQQADPPSQ